MTFDYIEMDGLLYPNIALENPEKLNSLGKYGRLRLQYLKLQKPWLFRELVIIGQLAEHCEQMEEQANRLFECVQESYINRHPLPENDFWERLAIRTMAQMVADEVVCHELIYV